MARAGRGVGVGTAEAEAEEGRAVAVGAGAWGVAVEARAPGNGSRPCVCANGWVPLGRVATTRMKNRATMAVTRRYFVTRFPWEGDRL